MKLKANTLRDITVFVAACTIWAGLLSEPLPILVSSVFIGKEAADSENQQIGEWIFGSRLVDWLLIVLGIMQWFIYRRQALILDRQTDIQEQQAATTHQQHIAANRPRLILRDAFSLITDPDVSSIVVHYALVNAGGSECYMTECHLSVQLVTEMRYPQFFMTPNRSIPSNVPFIGRIRPGKRHEFRFTGSRRRWDTQHRDGYPSPGGVHFVGHIAYMDAPGSDITYHMAFRRRFDIETQRFCRIEGISDDHEYSD